jgi:hypothetical protein
MQGASWRTASQTFLAMEVLSPWDTSMRIDSHSISWPLVEEWKDRGVRASASATVVVFPASVSSALRMGLRTFCVWRVHHS